MDTDSTALISVEASSVTELCEQVLDANQHSDQAQLDEAIGVIALLLGTITRQSKADTLRAAFREIAQTCSVPDTRQILKMAKTGLTTEQLEWLETQLHAIADGQQPE